MAPLTLVVRFAPVDFRDSGLQIFQGDILKPEHDLLGSKRSNSRHIQVVA